VAGTAEDVTPLDAAGLLAAELAVLLEDEHAAADMPAAQVARVSAAERYLFIGSPCFDQRQRLRKDRTRVPTIDGYQA
jgi:hypothetical protein